MRIVARLLVLLPLLWVEGVWAVDCTNVPYELSSQAQVDALGATGCDTFVGHLIIGPSTDITNIDSLVSITTVTYSLSISGNDLLSNLDGLINLSSVGEDISIYDNPNLSSLEGLAGLSGSVRSLSIYRNEALTDLDSLVGITEVRGNVDVGANGALVSIDGLANVVSVGSTLQISANNALRNLDGLTSLVSVGGNLEIGCRCNITIGGQVVGPGNKSLSDLDGLLSLTSVGGDLIIGGPTTASGPTDNGNTALTGLKGLAGLASVGGDIWIANNATLSNFEGLEKLNSVNGYLHISDNDALSNLNALSGVTRIGGDLVIYGNKSLANLTGLENVASIGGALDIRYNALLDLNGLAGVESVESYLVIERNTLLRDLDGLGSITSVGQNVGITSNPSLENIDGLANLQSVGGNFRVEGNPALGGCQGAAPVIGWPSGTPEDNVSGSMTISSNAAGCNSIPEILASVSGPTQPVITQATTSSNSISVVFTPSTTTDTLFPVTGYSASCTGSDVDVSGSPATDLLDNTPIQETLTVTGYDPASVLSSIEVDIDITHSDPSDLYITLTTPEGTELVLWNQGSTDGEDLIGTFPTTLTPVDSLDDVTRQTMDGDWVLSIEDIDVGPIVREGVLNSWGIRITEELARNDSGSPIEVSGATRGRDYTCTVAPVTKLGTTPVSDPYTVSVPLELPSVPTITSTDYEDGKIILTVSVSDNGGTDITGYEATCTDGTNTFTGTSTSSPITVSGLTNDVAYTCTVTATNSVGTSSPSAATDPITPEETATGLPIWLLYQATQ